MASKHPRADLYIAARETGMTYSEIAKKYGVSQQCVSQVCSRYGVGHFKPYTTDEVVYPNLRKWLNDNKVTRLEFTRRMGKPPYANSATQLSEQFRGKKNL